MGKAPARLGIRNGTGRNGESIGMRRASEGVRGCEDQ